MAIDRRKEDKAPLLVDEFRLEPRVMSSGEDQIDAATIEEAPKVPQSRSDEGPICDSRSCAKRSVVFLREHTFLKSVSTRMTCPNCLRGVETIVERDNTRTTHLSALLLLPVCLCILPYCSKLLRDTRHRCPECGIHLGARFASAREAFVVCLRRNAEPDEIFATNSVNEDSLF
ncbi:uncharacterized protein LOC103317027 [Nasonia vitripennis]|uniref:LITAF domain-containing protein n=1 Tax=Nasonia vitripennis TaxID=7425 RepID=A0A7M7HAC0_NASVI|nr:uncharacterized protein LOC103317027 [Nasonia vitripennis]